VSNQICVGLNECYSSQMAEPALQKRNFRRNHN